MEQFVYSDIFDTKGIEYIIVIFFFMLLIPFWYLLNRPAKLKKAAGDAIRRHQSAGSADTTGFVI